MSYQYQYDASGQLLRNRLYHINDAISYNVSNTDIDDMGTFSSDASDINVLNNYAYDEEGRLIKDEQEEIAKIIWTVSGKVKEIHRTATSSKNNLIFDYDAMGNRIAKQIVNNTTGVIEKSTYYILDAQGQQLAMYDFYVDDPNASTDFYLSERNIYGSSRLGVNKDIINMGNPAPLPSYGMLGNRYYELKNHLGNVLTVLNDHITPIDENNDQQADAYQVGISNTYDYSPFGVQLDGRTIAIPQTQTICQNETTSVTAIAFEDHFNNIFGTWTATGAANLAYLLGQMYVINSSGNNTIGASHDFTVSETSQHTVSFEIGCNTCGYFVPIYLPIGWFTLTYYVFVPNTIHVSVKDAMGNIVTSGNYTQTGTYNLTFTPATTGTYTINYSMNHASYSCEFSVKETKISFTQTQTNLVCENLPSGGYRYGFQGQEKDNEVSGAGNSYDFGARMYNPRVGRWSSVDAMASKQPDQSTYKAMLNNPIIYKDPDGHTEFLTIIIRNEQTGHSMKMSIPISDKVMTDGELHMVGSMGAWHHENAYYDYAHVHTFTLKKDGSIVHTGYTKTLNYRGVKDWDYVWNEGAKKGATQDEPSPFEMKGGFYMTSSGGEETKYYSDKAEYIGNIDGLVSALGGFETEGFVKENGKLSIKEVLEFVKRATSGVEQKETIVDEIDKVVNRDYVGSGDSHKPISNTIHWKKDNLGWYGNFEDASEEEIRSGDTMKGTFPEKQVYDKTKASSK